MSVASPTVRVKSSVSSKTGVSISPKPAPSSSPQAVVRMRRRTTASCGSRPEVPRGAGVDVLRAHDPGPRALPRAAVELRAAALGDVDGGLRAVGDGGGGADGADGAGAPRAGLAPHPYLVGLLQDPLRLLDGI